MPLRIPVAAHPFLPDLGVVVGISHLPHRFAPTTTPRSRALGWTPPMLAGVSTELPRSTPADQHVDPRAVLAFVDAVDADPAVEQHSLMVIRHGQVVAEGWWAPHTPERPRLLYSLSKSFTSTAFAFALQEKLVALDDTLVSHFPEFQADITDARSRSVTLRHLASMASGHNREMMQEAVTGDPQEPVRGF